MQPSSAFIERVFLRACMDERQESSYSDRIAVSALLKSSTTEGEKNRKSSCWGNHVSFVFDLRLSAFGFPLRLEVSFLFLNIKTKVAVRDAAGSWKLGVKRNEERFMRTGQLLF